MKLFNLYLHQDIQRSRLTSAAVRAMIDHRTVREWLATARIGEAQIVLTLSYRCGELWLKRIQ